MTKSVFQIVISLCLSFQANGQLRIEDPISIPLTGWQDSLRLTASKFCIGDTIINSNADLDLRFYRFMAFGDYKLIRISTVDQHNLKIDVYSLTAYKDSLIYHKTINNFETGVKVKGLLNKHNILNLTSLNYDYINQNSLPTVNDGNRYEVEAKVGTRFTFKEFDNPEIYSRYFSEKAEQAVSFTNFIRGLEILIDVKIAEPEL